MKKKRECPKCKIRFGAEKFYDETVESGNIGAVIGRLLCKIGIHKWKEGTTGSMLYPLAHKCKRCKIVRVFHGWGYTYGRDANDL